MHQPMLQSARERTQRWLSLCGMAAGPVFTLTWLIAGAFRSAYDPLRHPISSLAIGEQGWTQVASFMITGLLMAAFAVGLRRAFKGQPAGTWGPILLGLIALGLLGAGVFVTDPLNGYPVGTIALPVDYTFAGRLHRSLSALVFIGLPGACFVLARRFSRLGRRIWATYSNATGVGFLVLFVITSLGFGQVAGLQAVAGLFQRITLTVGWVWVFLLALDGFKAVGARV